MSEHVTEAEITTILTDAMERAGTHPAFVHAMQVCGFMVTEMNAGGFTDDELAQWEAAIDAYMADHPEAQPLG